VEHLGQQEWHIAHDEHDQGLDDPEVTRETWREAATESGQHSDERGPDDDDEEWDDTVDDVDQNDVVDANQAEPFEHPVQHLHTQYSTTVHKERWHSGPKRRFTCHKGRRYTEARAYGQTTNRKQPRNKNVLRRFLKQRYALDG